jgi:hypothetical protein
MIFNMTQEEKAKKYDKALEELRGLLEGIREEKREILEEDITSIFPELKESEDEKIRKRIIHALHGDVLDMEETNKAIAWLEKQGEQKPQGKTALEAINEEKVDNQFCVKSTDNVEPKFKVKYAGSEYNVLKVKDVSGVTFYGIEDEPNHIDYVKAENCERVDGYNIKEKGSLYPTKPAVFSEHKPAWSEEDERQWNNIWDVLDGHFELSEEGYKNAANWFKAIKGRVQSQPKQEWSEEDKETLGWLCTFLKEYGHEFYGGNEENVIDWLKRIGG